MVYEHWGVHSILNCWQQIRQEYLPEQNFQTLPSELDYFVTKSDIALGDIPGGGMDTATGPGTFHVPASVAPPAAFSAFLCLAPLKCMSNWS
jgi:hypothetical protein